MSLRKGHKLDRISGFKLDNLGKVLLFNVCLVDGNKVRHEFDRKFVGGANPARHEYVPKNEVWVESGLRRRGTAPVIVHEIAETILIRKHKKSYEQAHEDALLIEKDMRREIASGEIEKSDPATMAEAYLQRVSKAEWLLRVCSSKL